MKKLVIVGAGGVGRETSLILREINNYEPTWEVLGFIDDNPKKWGSIVDNHEILGGLDYLKKLEKDTHVVIAIANYKVKKRIVEELNGKFPFATIIHPRVLTHDFMTVGEGTIIYEGAILTIDIRIGNHVIISPKCGIGHDSIIKDYVTLLWNVNVSGNDVIDEGVLMGTGSTIIQNLKVGREATVGAGAVVVNDIPQGATVVGVPAKIIRQEVIYEKDFICNNG
ncbi:MAG: acetyltransferase [Clostridium sp.]|nr:acetyltransferase [Clostridium sp.]MDU7084656.1 acetyltransferase [Clostridium sp.]